MFVLIEAKARNPFLCVLRTHRLQDADRNHVLGLGQPLAQAHRAFKFSVVVLRLPWLAAGHASVEEERCIVDHGGWCKAFFQRGGIDEGLEAGAGLAPGLGYMVELVFFKIKTTHQRLDGAVTRIERHEGTFYFW